VRTAASFRAAGDVARVLVGEVWLRADGAGGGGFAKCSGMAKTLASAALRGIAERDVLADVAFPVEKQHLGVPQLGGADEGDDHGGGGLALSILGGGEPSRLLGQLRSWVEHLDLFTGVFWRGGGGDPIQNVSGPSLADVGRYGGDLGEGIADDAEERLVVAASVSGAGSEHEGVRSGDIGGIEWWDGDVRVSHQGSVDGAEGGIGCFLSVVGRFSKLDNDATFGGRVGLLPPFGLPRNNGFPCGIGGLGGSCEGRLCGGDGGGCRGRLRGGGCAGRLRGGGCGRGRLRGGGGGGRVTSSERAQLLRNSGDLLRQRSEVLRLGSRGRGSNGALEKAIDLLGKRGNGRNLLRGRSRDGGSGSRGGGRTCEKAIDLLGQSGNSLNQLGVGGSDGGGTCEEVVDPLSQVIDVLVQSIGVVECVVVHGIDSVKHGLKVAVNGIHSDEVFAERELDLIEAGIGGGGAGCGGRRSLNSQRRGGVRTRSRRVWWARGLLTRPLRGGLLGPRIRSRGCRCRIFSIWKDGKETVVV
jgi:hypothetical protein